MFQRNDINGGNENLNVYCLYYIILLAEAVTLSKYRGVMYRKRKRLVRK